MSERLGYDLQRVRHLGLLTLAAIDDCARLRSTDPAAADALRAVRLARRNLEDLWMPAVRDIERSEAMVSWPALQPLSDREVLDELTWMGAFLAAGQPPGDGELEMLADEVRRRATADPAFADRLVQLARTVPLVGQLAELADFGGALTGRLLAAILHPAEPGLLGATPHHRRAIEALIADLLADPGACLDVLMVPGVLADLAARPDLDADTDLDPDLVSAFVVAGLHGAVAADTSRLPDSYRVLGELIEMTNGPREHGLPPAIAFGVATSMVGYIDTLAPAIRQEGRSRVVVLDDATGLDLDIGTYDDLLDLFGALLRDAEAQAALGTVLGGYTTAVIGSLGADVTRLPGIEHVARFADLLADATLTEQAELVLEAAAEEARLRMIGDAIGFGTTAALTLTGAASVTRVVASRAISLATDFSVRTPPAELPDARLPAGTYDLIVVSAVSVMVTDTAARRAAGLGSLARSDRAELARQVDGFTAESDPDERHRRARRLDHWIEANVPALAAHLHRVRSSPGMDELTESRSPATPD